VENGEQPVHGAGVAERRQGRSDADVDAMSRIPLLAVVVSTRRGACRGMADLRGSRKVVASDNVRGQMMCPGL
jgi:hypothetical protein